MAFVIIILSRPGSLMGENLVSCGTLIGSVVYGVISLHFLQMVSIFGGRTLQNAQLALGLSMLLAVGWCCLVP